MYGWIAASIVAFVFGHFVFVGAITQVAKGETATKSTAIIAIISFGAICGSVVAAFMAGMTA